MKSLLLPVTLTCHVLLFCIAGFCQPRLYSNTFPLGDVALLDGPFKKARDLNIKTLLQYDVDRLLQPFLKEAGLTPKASGYTNWAGLDGHVGGHYLSALAMNYAATGNPVCKQRMDYMIATLKTCQQANTLHEPGWGKGYVGGVPDSKKIWAAVKTGNLAPYRAAWVPWYNVHKLYAGLRDAWLYTGNENAKTVFLQFCDWGIQLTAGLTDVQMQSMLDVEHGGMPEIFADAWQMTGDARYLAAAKRFCHHMLLDAMAAQQDNLDNKHANTQVPKVVGFERIAEVAHDDTCHQAGRFFWETVTTNRSLAFGGNSRREIFPAASACIDFINDVEGPETCNSYNMLKLTEDLFRMEPAAKYADFYERTLYNHILSTQHPVHGGYVYFTPARPRHYRVYSAPNEAMWCCVGSGMENHSKYNQFIYTHRHDSLYVNLFIASELNWKEKKVKIRQETVFPAAAQTRLTITEGSAPWTLMVRYPAWVQEGALKITVNGKNVPYRVHPASYVAVHRLWKKGDVIQVQLPMHTTIEPLPNVPNYVAFMYGPVLLGARTGAEELTGLVANDSRWGHIAGGKRLPVDKAPVIIEDDLAGKAAGLVPVKDHPLHFTFPALTFINPLSVQLEPFYQIHDARYMMYWMALTKTAYHTYLDSVAAVEKQQLALQQRTIDFVAPGEQQPEADHLLQKENSNTGNHLNEFWRDARNEGFFSYQLSTNGETNVSLLVRYWGAEWGNRKFDIYINDGKLLTEDNTGKWNQSAFHEINYPIPDALVKGKTQVRVKFQALPGSTAGAVYYLRLLRKQPGNDTTLPSLKNTFQKDFLIGTALNTQQILEQDAGAAALVPVQFNALTPENVMKAAIIHPEWDRYNFTLADKLVDLGEKYHCKINGHTLIWHSQLPAFVRTMKSADSLRQYMINHITTVAGRYKNKVYSWDVVNEALAEDGTLRHSMFWQLLGEDYIVDAFRLAQQAAPDAQLYYNDYNIESPKKRAGAIALIKKIQAAGVRIDGVGIQGHWRAGHVPLADIEQSIREFSALGIKVMFTELDLSVLPNPWRGDNADVNAATANANQTMDPYPNGLPDSLQTLLSTAYTNLFQLFLKYSRQVSRVTFWGVNDGQSWLNNFPVRGRTNYPLLFDRAFEPKPAFYSVIAAKKNN